jgi:CubicO group peptidase (beta-lactamase class C family)
VTRIATDERQDCIQERKNDPTEAAGQTRGIKHMKIKILLATLLTLALFTAGHAQTLDKAKLDQFFDRLAEKNKAMGSLVIVKDGKVLYIRAIGYSQINPNKPLTAANRFRIASITKMFTAAMILQLVEEGN